MQTFPKVSDLCSVAGISFPLTVEACDPNTKTASLKGEHPQTGMEVVLPLVCLSLLQEPRETLAFKTGDFVQLKSGSPVLVVSGIDDEGKLFRCIAWIEQAQAFTEIWASGGALRKAI